MSRKTTRRKLIIQAPFSPSRKKDRPPCRKISSNVANTRQHIRKSSMTKHSFSSVIWYMAVLGLLMGFSQTSLARPNSFSPIVKSEKEKIVNISTSAVVKHPNIKSDPFFERFYKNMPKQQRQSALGSGLLSAKMGILLPTIM